jgi:hypothetical protein
MTPTQQETEALLKRINNDIEYFDGREDKQSVDYEFGNLELTVGDLKTIRAVLQSHAQKVGADIGIKCERHIYGNMAPWPRKCLNGCNGDEFDHTQEEAADSIKNILAKKKPASDGSEQLDVDLEAIKRELAKELYGHSDEMWSLPFADHAVLDFLFKRNLLRGRDKYLQFIANSGFNWRDYCIHVVKRGGCGDVGDLTSFLDPLIASEGRETG